MIIFKKKLLDNSVDIFVVHESNLVILPTNCLCYPYSSLITEAEKVSHSPLSLQVLLPKVHVLIRHFSPST